MNFFSIATNESKALSDVQTLRPALWPPLSLDRELCWWAEPPLVRHLPASAASRSVVGFSHCSVRLRATFLHLNVLLEGSATLTFVPQVWNLSQWHLGLVVQEQHFPSGESGHCWYFLCGGRAAAGLPPLPGVHQLYHLGVHVTSQDLLPEALWQWARPVRPRSLLQLVGLLLHLQDCGVGANVPR